MNPHTEAWMHSGGTNAGPMRKPFFKRRNKWWMAAGLATFGWLAPIPMPGQTNPTPQILFLHLKVKNQTVSLVDSVTRPGALKGPREAALDNLHYELLSGTGESLWKGAVADPSIRHLEYEDPPNSGNLKRKTIVLDEAEFSVRVPVVPKARRIDFYKLEPLATEAKGEEALIKKSLGSLLLP